MNDWAKRVEADVQRMVAAGLAYLDAGGTGCCIARGTVEG